MIVPRASRCFSRALRPARRPALCAYSAEHTRGVKREIKRACQGEAPTQPCLLLSGTRDSYLVLLRPRPGHLCTRIRPNTRSILFRRALGASSRRRSGRRRGSLKRHKDLLFEVLNAFIPHFSPTRALNVATPRVRPRELAENCRWILERTRVRPR